MLQQQPSFQENVNNLISSTGFYFNDNVEVDIDYDGKIFDMDRTVFSKDISENGEIKLAGLTESVAVIAIDKHGNESKPVIL